MRRHASVSESIAGASYKACETGLGIAKGETAMPADESTSALSGVCAEYAKACAPTSECRGPRVLVCGPTDSGGRRLRDAMCIWQPRLGREPVSVDLDPGLGDCGGAAPAPSRRVVLIEIGPRSRRASSVGLMTLR